MSLVVLAACGNIILNEQIHWESNNKSIHVGGWFQAVERTKEAIFPAPVLWVSFLLLTLWALWFAIVLVCKICPHLIQIFCFVGIVSVIGHCSLTGLFVCAPSQQLNMPNALLLPQFQPIMVNSQRFPISIHLVGFIQQWIRILHSHDEKFKRSQTLSMPFLWRCRCRWCRTTNPPFVTPYSTGHWLPNCLIFFPFFPLRLDFPVIKLNLQNWNCKMYHKYTGQKKLKAAPLHYALSNEN